MKIYLTAALAAGLALSPVGAPAFAQEQQAEDATAQFRTVQPQTFSAEDLQRYGLDPTEVAKAQELQAQGYRIVALTPEQAEAYQAGSISQTEWILIGIGVLIILAIA